MRRHFPSAPVCEVGVCVCWLVCATLWTEYHTRDIVGFIYLFKIEIVALHKSTQRNIKNNTMLSLDKKQAIRFWDRSVMDPDLYL